MGSASGQIDLLFRPRSIAVIGASANPRKLGYALLDNLQRSRFKGDLYAVNPKGGRILGIEAVATVGDLPLTPDLVVIAVPQPAVREVVQQCGEAGVRAAIVITAGFRETGSAGRKAEYELVEVARRYGIRLVGPNSVGVINTAVGLNATFAETAPLEYEVGMLSQSGAVATAILDWARSVNMGFSKFVSLGNMADLNEADFIEYLGDDPDTRVIVGYLEGFRDARRFLEVSKHVSRKKPIVLMKVGNTASGARAASSHTGALASQEALVAAAFRQAGIVRAPTMEVLFDYVRAFSYSPLPSGPRVAILTNAGGPAVMASDAVDRAGLELAPLSGATLKALSAALPAAASVDNPVDVLGDATSDLYQEALSVLAADDSVDSLLVLLTPQRMTEPERTARAISFLAREQSKPILASFMGGTAVDRARAMLDGARVPVFNYPERAVGALSALVEYSRYRQETKAEAASQ